jgi:hypothetical protein
MGHLLNYSAELTASWKHFAVMLKYFDQKALYSPSKVLELVTPCIVSSTQQSFEIASNFPPFFIFVQAAEIYEEKGGRREVGAK